MPYRKTKEERKAWWNSLSKEQQSQYVSQRENRRAIKNNAPALVLNITPLTSKEMQVINSTMRTIGLEAYIVLPDTSSNTEGKEATMPKVPKYPNNKLLHRIPKVVDKPRAIPVKKPKP